MTDIPDSYGHLTEPTTLTIERLLPGPAERVWDYLTKSDLRRRWLASGEMDLTPGGALTLTWRNDELTVPPGARPEGFPDEHSMTGEILVADPPNRLAFTWPGVGEVTFDLAPRGDDVLLTVTHRKVPDHNTLLSVSAGWHTHLDLLAAAISGTTTPPFWDHMAQLKEDYAARFTA